MELDEAIIAGRDALSRGDWAAARAAFERAVAQHPTGEALEALGTACWWQDDQKAVLETREHAYRRYREEGDPRSAARVATVLGLDYGDYRGDFAVMNGWLQRAESLLRDVPLAPEHGWLHVYQGYVCLMFMNDIAGARSHLAALVELGPKIGSVDVEMMSVGLRGLIEIREGNVTQGMRHLDEAMTAAVGGDMSDLTAIGNTCCSLIYACEAVADYDRAAQWCARAREFTKRMGLDAFFAICRNYYATVLIWNGNWDEADAELTAALRELETNRPSYAMESLAKLGELRRRQGRLEEAADILARAEPHRTAIFGQAALALDRGDAERAIDLLQRVLRRVGEEDQAERVFILELLARAFVAAGRVDDAAAVLPEMETVSSVIGTAPLYATLTATRGVVELGRGNVDLARQHLEDAVDQFETAGAGFDAARVRLDLVDALHKLGRDATAVEQAMLANAAFNRLGAGLYAQRAAGLVAELAKGLSKPPEPAALPYGLTAREGEVLWLIAAGKTNQEIAQELVLSVRTVERHISTVYEKLGLHGRAARASAASIAFSLQANT